jgi:hypothetical protein
MEPHEKRYWPFQVLPPESQTEEQKCQVRFLEAAYQDGYKPYMETAGNFGATTGVRGGMILFRGRKHWQVLLGTTDETVVSAHLDDFCAAADAVLQWLHGLDGAAVVDRFRDHLVATRATGRGFVLHEQPG